jgi:hypothetical protein
MWYRMWLSGTITENTSWHGKRWIMKVYDDKWLLESIPYDKLSTSSSLSSLSIRSAK